jgi:hypothetical protein
MAPTVVEALVELAGEIHADTPETDFLAGTELTEGFPVGSDDAGENGVATGGGVFAAQHLGLARRGNLNGPVPGAATDQGLRGDWQGEAVETDGHAGGLFTDAVDGAGEEGKDFGREEVGVGTGDDAEHLDAVYQKRRIPIFAERGAGDGRGQGGQGKFGPALEDAAAEAALEVGGGAAVPAGNGEAAGKGDIAAEAVAGEFALEGVAGANFDGLAVAQGAAIEPPAEVGAAEGDAGGLLKEEARGLQGDFERGKYGGIAGSVVGLGQTVGAHGAGFAEAIAGEAVAGKVLNGGEAAGFEEFDHGDYQDLGLAG